MILEGRKRKFKQKSEGNATGKMLGKTVNGQTKKLQLTTGESFTINNSVIQQGLKEGESGRGSCRKRVIEQSSDIKK